MKRKSFLKSLLVVLIAPKILTEISVNTASVVNKPIFVNGNKPLISQLKLLTPYYYQDYVEKYGSENFIEVMMMVGSIKANQEYLWYENESKLIQKL